MVHCYSGVVRFLKANISGNKQVKYQFVAGDVEWTNKVIFKFAAFATVGKRVSQTDFPVYEPIIILNLGGSLSSLVGLGGGVIFNPLMLEFGVHPKVCSSTSSYLVMLSTLAATVQYIFMDILPLDYALGIGFFVILFSLIGNFTLDKAVQKVKRPSMIALFLAGVMILCTVIVLVTSALDFIVSYATGEDMLDGE